MSSSLSTESAGGEGARVAWWKNEDWVAAGLGALVIVLVLAGLRPELPKFAWSGAEDGLANSVLSPANLFKALLIGLLYLVLSAGGIALLDSRKVRRFVLGFPVVYALSLLARVTRRQCDRQLLGR
ncbi:MAG: hypothetical protein WKF84_29035 [Pyrinomonadaceae bacterium]